MTFSKSHFVFAEWQKELKLSQQQKNHRKLKLPKGLDFSSNDYLSLSQETSIRKSLIQALKNSALSTTPLSSKTSPPPTKKAKHPSFPLSSGGSRLIRGHSLYHAQLENSFQKWIGRESALFFSSGYMANIGIINVLPKNTWLFSDQLNHASLIDACRLSKLTCHIYPHKDTQHLKHLLKKTKSKNKVIITESLFSMGGDFAPLQELSSLALKHQALLIVDEAHATGIYGHKGRGLADCLKQKNHIITIHPCGKALSANGAFIAGPRILKQYLINKCRTFIYTTAPSPIVAFHIQCVLHFLKDHPQRREQVQQKARFFRSLLSKSFGLTDSESVIIPVVIGNSKKALHCAQYLQKKGYDIRAIRYPTVPQGQELLRICIHYNHTKKQLKSLATHLNRWQTLF